jgi:hypothetical protein
MCCNCGLEVLLLAHSDPPTVASKLLSTTKLRKYPDNSLAMNGGLIIQNFNPQSGMSQTTTADAALIDSFATLTLQGIPLNKYSKPEYLGDKSSGEISKRNSTGTLII